MLDEVGVELRHLDVFARHEIRKWRVRDPTAAPAE